MKHEAIYIISSIFILFLHIFAGCSDQIDSPDDRYEKLIPLKVGNKWNYNITHYDSLHNITSQSKYSESVIRDTLIAGKRWYALSYQPNNLWFANSEDGFWRIDKNVETDIHYRLSLVYKYPAYSGDSYDYFNVLSTNAEISVPAGNFNGMHLIGNDNFPHPLYYDSFEIFITPGIGKIKWLQKCRTPSFKSYTEYTCELESYIIQ